MGCAIGVITKVSPLRTTPKKNDAAKVAMKHVSCEVEPLREDRVAIGVGHERGVLEDYVFACDGGEVDHEVHLLRRRNREDVQVLGVLEEPVVAADLHEGGVRGAEGELVDACIPRVHEAEAVLAVHGHDCHDFSLAVWDQVSRVTKMLGDEFGTASNIKNRVKGQSVLGEIQRMQEKQQRTDISGIEKEDTVEGIAQTEQPPAYELTKEEGMRLAKEYSRFLMKEARLTAAAENVRLQLRKDSIAALPLQLRGKALVPDFTPFPPTRIPASLTPPIPGYLAT